MSLRSYIFLWLSFISTVAAVVLTAVESHQLGRLLIEESDEAHRLAVTALTDQVEQAIDTDLRAQQAAARAIEVRLRELATTGPAAGALTVHELPKEQLARILVDYRGSTDLYMVCIGDPAGRAEVFDPQVDQTGAPLPPTDYSDRDYVQKVIHTGEPQVSRVERGRLFPVTSVHIASPIRGPTQRLAGYIAGALDMTPFQRMVDQAAARLVGAEVVLLDARGEVIASSGESRFALMQDLTGVGLYSPPTEGEVTTREGPDSHGRPVRAAAALTKRLGLSWTAVVYRPTRVIAGKISETRQRAFLASALVLLIALLIAFMLATLMATPLQRLAGVAKAIGLGEFQRAPAPPPWAPTEVRSLAAAIAEMSAKLEAHSAERDAKVRELSDSNTLLTESLLALNEAQEKLLQAGRLAAVGQLAGGIAHDFNNLLTIILTTARFLEQGLAENPEASADAREIAKAAQRGANLTRQLLAFSRRQVLLPQVVDLNGVLTEMQPTLLRLIGEGVQLTFEPCATPANALVDPVQMEQVLLNLVSNARDALPSGGHLRIALERVGPTVAQELGRLSSTVAEWLVLSVADDGIGMPEKVRARIFEPFFTTKGPDKGTGLGLATVYGIVKQSGGEVAVTSAEGKGTTFRVLLPAADQGDLAFEKRPLIAPDPGVTATLVLVDDESAIRLMTTRILKRAGYHVLDAGSPGEALAIAARLKQPIDLLLTDVLMPDLSGPKLAERFLAIHPETQVLYMSGYSASVGGVPTDDADHFLQKPFTPEDLIAKIRGLLKRATSRSSPS